jgi:hypothetical protein
MLAIVARFALHLGGPSVNGIHSLFHCGGFVDAVMAQVHHHGFRRPPRAVYVYFPTKELRVLRGGGTRMRGTIHSCRTRLTVRCIGRSRLHPVCSSGARELRQKQHKNWRVSLYSQPRFWHDFEPLTDLHSKLAVVSDFTYHFA